MWVLVLGWLLVGCGGAPLPETGQVFPGDWWQSARTCLQLADDGSVMWMGADGAVVVDGAWGGGIGPDDGPWVYEITFPKSEPQAWTVTWVSLDTWDLDNGDTVKTYTDCLFTPADSSLRRSPSATPAP